MSRTQTPGTTRTTTTTAVQSPRDRDGARTARGFAAFVAVSVAVVVAAVVPVVAAAVGVAVAVTAGTAVAARRRTAGTRDPPDDAVPTPSRAGPTAD